MKAASSYGLILVLAGMAALAQTNSMPMPAQARLPIVAPASQRLTSTRATLSSPPQRRSAKPLTSNGPEQVLYAFQGGTDGQYPSGVIFDSSGNLYGTTEYGGTGTCTSAGINGCGTVFELSPNGSGGWTKTTLYNFQGGTDGEYPYGGVVFDQAGNLYGATIDGGANSNGTVFELSPNGGGSWAETILYSFGATSSDGEGPVGALTFDQSGNLYGATLTGGNPTCDHDGFQSCGTVFELSPNGSGGWSETTLFAFPTGDSGGYGPNGGLIFDHSGNLYGTTPDGGANSCEGSGGCGTAFEVSPNGSGPWTETLLYSFGASSDDGIFPLGGVIFDQSGNLYGTTEETGSAYTYGAGTVFQLSPNGSGGWTETILHNFQLTNDGNGPSGVLIFDQSGNLYGTTYAGGNAVCPNSCGTAFELSPNGSGGWDETILYEFQGGSDGGGPAAGVIFDQSGHLYGTTQLGGGSASCTGGCGTVFEISRESFAAIAPTSVGFGNQNDGTTSAAATATLTNTGNLPFTVSSIAITGANSAEFGQTNNCTILGASATCTIDVTFSPSSAGAASATLTVTENAPDSSLSVSLTGTGTGAITVSLSSVTFPGQYVGTSGLNQNVQLTNNGPNVLTITSVAATPSSDFSALSACGNSLSVGASCSIGVFFDPSASGTRTGTLTITDSAPGSPQVVALTGTGEDFSMAASAPSQTVSPGQTATYSLTVTPLGGFKQSVQLSCSGASAGATCTVSPSAATLNGSASQAVTVTVAAAGMSAGLVSPAGLKLARNSLGAWLALPGIFGFVVIVLPAGSRRVKYRGGLCALTLLCLLTLALILMMPACGGASTGGSAATYHVTVTGAFTSGGTTLTHATTLTLIVQ